MRPAHDEPLDESEERQILKICDALVTKYGIINAESRLDEAFVRGFDHLPDHDDGIKYLLDGIRTHVGSGPTDAEVKLMAIAVISCLSGDEQDVMAPAITDVISTDEMRTLLRP